MGNLNKSWEPLGTTPKSWAVPCWNIFSAQPWARPAPASTMCQNTTKIAKPANLPAVIGSPRFLALPPKVHHLPKNNICVVFRPRASEITPEFLKFH